MEDMCYFAFILCYFFNDGFCVDIPSYVLVNAQLYTPINFVDSNGDIK